MIDSKDPDCLSVYLSEEIAFEGTFFVDLLDIDDLLVLADRLFHHEWWVRNKISVPTIEPTRSTDTSSHAETDGDKYSVIRLTPNSINPLFLAHEASHIAQYYFYRPSFNPNLETHGREFRACYLIVAEILLGRTAADDLRRNFERRLPTRPEHAPGMPGSILTVPRLDPTYDPDGHGIFQRWRLVAQAAAIENARQDARAYVGIPPLETSIP